jgi:hypothetical protein
MRVELGVSERSHPRLQRIRTHRRRLREDRNHRVRIIVPAPLLAALLTVDNTALGAIRQVVFTFIVIMVVFHFASISLSPLAANLNAQYTTAHIRAREETPITANPVDTAECGIPRLRQLSLTWGLDTVTIPGSLMM